MYFEVNGALGQTAQKHVMLVSGQDQEPVRLILSGVEPKGLRKAHAVLLLVRIFQFRHR